MYQDILVPTDGGESVGQVLEHTIDIADGRDVTAHILYVVDDRAFLAMDEDMHADVLANLEAEGEAAVSEVAETLEQAGIETTTHIAQGDPAERIVEYVDDAGIDLVTMGTQAGEYEKNMLGSTSQKVVTKSPVPVLTVNLSESSDDR